MSHELSELFAMLGFGVGLAALFQRARQRVALRLGARAVARLRLPARRPR